ncbi:hypothetical protein BKA93DRAFT_746612 [Sparassis latifolia]
MYTPRHRLTDSLTHAPASLLRITHTGLDGRASSLSPKLGTTTPFAEKSGRRSYRQRSITVKIASPDCASIDAKSVPDLPQPTRSNPGSRKTHEIFAKIAKLQRAVWSVPDDVPLRKRAQLAEHFTAIGPSDSQQLNAPVNNFSGERSLKFPGTLRPNFEQDSAASIVETLGDRHRRGFLAVSIQLPKALQCRRVRMATENAQLSLEWLSMMRRDEPAPRTCGPRVNSDHREHPPFAGELEVGESQPGFKIMQEPPTGVNHVGPDIKPQTLARRRLTSSHSSNGMSSLPDDLHNFFELQDIANASPADAAAECFHDKTITSEKNLSREQHPASTGVPRMEPLAYEQCRTALQHCDAHDVNILAGYLVEEEFEGHYDPEYPHKTADPAASRNKDQLLTPQPANMQAWEMAGSRKFQRLST